MDYLEEGRNIWSQFVPKSGQAQTVQGELLRAVEKLRDEAIRNGNGNWDRGFEILLEFLDGHLLDAHVFAPDVLGQTKATLSRLRIYENPLLDDGPYDALGDRVVDYFHHHGSQPHPNNPELFR